MEIRKTYREINPELLFDEIRDFAIKQGAAVRESSIETYSRPGDSSSFITRGTMVLTVTDSSGNPSECCRVHIVGSARDRTILMIDADERVFSASKIEAMRKDIDYVFSNSELRE